jgi:hypothetical protein
MPKTGSGTHVHLFRHLHKENNFTSWTIPETLRENNKLYTNTRARKEFDESIISKLRKKERIIVNGHYSRVEFTPSEFSGKTLESINTLRDCESWSISKLYWTMKDSKNARRYIEKGEKKYKEYVKEILGRGVTFDKCIQDYNCLKGNKLFHDQDEQAKFICGNECIERHNGVLKGAISNIDDPSMFTDIGILKYIDQNLEMLECIYPKMLKGI